MVLSRCVTELKKMSVHFALHTGTNRASVIIRVRMFFITFLLAYLNESDISDMSLYSEGG